MLILRITLGQNIAFFVCQKCSVTQNMPKMRSRPGLRPGPRWGAHEAPPDQLVGWGGDTSGILLLGYFS